MLPKAIVGILVLALIGTSAGLLTIYLNFRDAQSSLHSVTAELEETRETLHNYRELNQGLASANDDLVAKIQEQAVRNHQLEAINSDLVAESRRIYEEVQHVEELNVSLDQEIRDVTATNNALNRENHTLATVNIQLEADRESLNHSLETAEENARAIQEQNERNTLTIHALEQDKATLTADVMDLQDQNHLLGQKNDQQTDAIQALEREKEELTVDVTELTSDVTALRGRNQSLAELNATYQNKSGTLNQLNTRIDSLRAEIRRLEDQRRPLLLQTGRSNFACTGSMEPKITCLDSATYLENFLPQDIRVGTVISFDPPATCRVQSNRGIAHRVEKVKVERNIYYYWPKGDNAEQADGCWVSEKDVSGYIIDLHKNTNPERAELRTLVNSADAEAKRARDAYYNRRASYGCPDPNRVCTVSRERFIELSRLRQTYLAASNYHWCWVQAAKNAWYPRSGKPVYSICSK